MHRRLWLLAGAGAAMLLLAVSATATTKVAGSAHRPSWPLPRSPSRGRTSRERLPAARRRASSSSVVSRTSSGFNTVQPTQNAYWAAVDRQHADIRGIYIIDDQGDYHLDLASTVTATKTGLSITIRPDANWNWGGKKVPVTYKDFVYTWQQIVEPERTTPASTTGYDQITGFTHKGTKQITFNWKTQAVRRLPRPVRPRLSVGGARRPRLEHVSGPTASAVTTASRSPTVRSCSRTTRRARADPEGEPLLVRQEAGPEGGRLQADHGHELRDPGDARRRGRRDLPVPADRSLAAQGPGRDHLQLDPGLHAWSTSTSSRPAGQPAAEAAVDAAGD